MDDTLLKPGKKEEIINRYTNIIEDYQKIIDGDLCGFATKCELKRKIDNLRSKIYDIRHGLETY